DFADYADPDPAAGLPPPPPPPPPPGTARLPAVSRPSAFDPGSDADYRQPPPAPPRGSAPVAAPPSSWDPRPAPPPRPSSSPSRAPLPSFPSPSPSAARAPAATASERQPPATPRTAAAPPRWLLDPPPAGFWPVERKRADPRRYEIIQLGPTAPDELQLAPDLGIRFDTTSWFPVLEGREQVRGAYLLSMAMFGDGPSGTAFRWPSTLLVTSARLVGLPAKGESACV